MAIGVGVICLLLGSALGFIMGNAIPNNEDNLKTKIISSLKYTWIIFSFVILFVIVFALAGV